jgi:hypothetical protein
MPVPAATSASAFFAPGFAVCKAVAADHNCNQTRNFGDRASEKALDCVKPGVEGTSLGLRGEWSQDENAEHQR